MTSMPCTRHAVHNLTIPLDSADSTFPINCSARPWAGNNVERFGLWFSSSLLQAMRERACSYTPHSQVAEEALGDQHIRGVRGWTTLYYKYSK